MRHLLTLKLDSLFSRHFRPNQTVTVQLNQHLRQEMTLTVEV